MQLFEELKKVVAEAEEDAVKFYSKNNSAAGTRLRKHMQTLKEKAQEIRNNVSELKKDGE